MSAFPWEQELPNTPAAEEIHAADPEPKDPIVVEAAKVSGDRTPYVGEGADGARRSAQIDREEVDGLDGDDPRVPRLLASADRWDAQADRLMVEEDGTKEPDPSTDVVTSTAAIDLRAVDELLDDLSDPKRLTDTVGSMRETILDVVRRRADLRHADRVERLGDEGPTSSTDVRREAVGAANDHDALSALAGAFTAGATEAKLIAGELLDELPGRGGKARASLKVADGNGFDLSIVRSRATELAVDVEEVVDVLVAHLVADAAGTEALDLKTHPSKVYAAGIRSGIDALFDLLASPKFKSTALDSLATRLEDADDDSLAVRLRKSYAKREKGNPSVKVERKPIPAKDGGDSNV